MLYGIRLMSEGLQKVAGRRLRQVLEAVSSNRIMGVLLGMGVTAAVQSSSAISVTVVGFVNAGLMTLTQAAGVILGANVGTTITAQLIAFKLSDLAPVGIFIAVGMIFFARRNKIRHIGEVILGFGLLFFGLGLMSNALKPLSNDPEFIMFFSMFKADDFSGILLCVLAGTALCVALQSSTAAVGIVMTLADQGLLSFYGAVAIVLGDNIGTTITAIIASVGTTLAAKRTAAVHMLFNVFGVCYIVILFYPFVSVVEWATQLIGIAPLPEPGVAAGNISRYVANAHTLFNVINVLVFLPLLPLLVKTAILITPGKDSEQDLEDMARPKFINPKFVETPDAALAGVHEEVARMGQIAQRMFHEVSRTVITGDTEALDKWRKSEEALDRLRRAVLEYLVQVSRGPIGDQEGKEVAAFMRIADDLERLGDSVENLAESIERMEEAGLKFTETAMVDYTKVTNLVSNFLELVVRGMSEHDDDILEVAAQMEEEVDQMRDRMRNDHVERLRQGQCTVDAGLLFVNMLANFEKIGDYLYSISWSLNDIREA